MPTSADRAPELLLDASVAVALSVADHEGRVAARAAVQGRRLGLAGHAAFESFSVLTRLPGPARRTPAAVARLLTRNFPHTRYPSPGAVAALFGRLAELGLAGGAVYDALVAVAAVELGVPLATRDRRALGTYHILDVEVIMVR